MCRLLGVEKITNEVDYINQMINKKFDVDNAELKYQSLIFFVLRLTTIWNSVKGIKMYTER
jgi:hypothetical protein